MSTMDVKLKEIAPWNKLKLKTGVYINKDTFTPIEDPVVKEQLNSTLKKMIIIEGDEEETTTTKPTRRRKLKETPLKPIEKKTTKVVEEKEKKVLIDNGKLTKTELKKAYKQDIVDILLKRDFTKKDLKGMKKDKLIEVYLIDIQ